MKFKALIFDLDGTAIPNKPNGLPSKLVVEAVEKIKQQLIVTIATGRPISNARPILKKFNLSYPCIISGGTQIIDPQTEKTLWEQRMTERQVGKVIEVCKPYSYKILFGEELDGVPAKNKTVTGTERVIYLMTVAKKDALKLLGRLRSIQDVTAHEVKSWTKNHVDIHITHSQATKKQALVKLFDMLKIKKEQAVGVGDSNNDLPLFEMVGYKVAMGNASNELKKQADYIAPPVEKDGLARLIENKLVVLGFVKK